MKVLLRAKVAGLGNSGEIHDVPDAYARNFLLPKKLAVLATSTIIESKTRLEAAAVQKNQSIIRDSQAIAARLSERPISIEARATSEGKLFGGISSKDVEATLQKKFGVFIDRKSITIVKPIHTVGLHTINVRLPGNIEASLQLTIKAT